MENKNGDLFTHNLWSFWEAIPFKKRELIIDQFKTGASFWDYNSLFQGFEKEGSDQHGDINILDIILNINDLELCDLAYEKFNSFKSENYLLNSFWGEKWSKRVNALKERAIQRNNVDLAEFYGSLTPDSIYWKDAHFFVSNYAKRVYKLHLDGFCDIKRFENAVSFEFENSEKINEAVFKLINSNCSNPVFEQYLIYLEKQKEYKKCIELMQNDKLLKWNNNFDKRLSRCYLKLNKSK